MKLTAAEKKWLSDFQSLLDACPSKRLAFYTIGDPCITVYDKTKDGAINEMMDSGKASDYGIAVDRLKAEIVSLRFPSHVHSVAG